MEYIMSHRAGVLFEGLGADEEIKEAHRSDAKHGRSNRWKH
jgi:hypothetical protein